MYESGAGKHGYRSAVMKTPVSHRENSMVLIMPKLCATRFQSKGCKLFLQCLTHSLQAFSCCFCNNNAEKVVYLEKRVKSTWALRHASGRIYSVKSVTDF